MVKFHTELRAGLGVALPTMRSNALALTDQQLRAILTVGALVAYSDRDVWLRTVASKLTNQTVTNDALYAALLETCEISA